MARLLPIIALVGLLVTTACGGGGGGGGGEDVTPALVEVTFPTLRCLAAGPTLTIRGRSPDPAGVTQVEVQGIPATSTDGFAFICRPSLDPFR